VNSAGAVSDTVATRHWTKLEDGRIRCDVCPRECKLHEGQRGLCFVRAAEAGEIVLKTWGPLVRILRRPDREKTAQPLSSWNAGAVFRHGGMQPLLLLLSEPRHFQEPRNRYACRPAQRPRFSPKLASKLGCRSIAFTYNDPTIFFEYAIGRRRSLSRQGRQDGIGYGWLHESAPREEFYRHIDAANVDLKAFTEDFYFKITKSHLAPVLDTLEYLKHETKTWWRSHAADPGENDSPKRSSNCRAGWSTNWDPTCRCISRRSIPIIACWINRPHRTQR
jgi:pyruvate formate lyase activating enzyme